MMRGITRLFLGLILGIGALIMLLPFIWMVTTALKSNTEALQIPPTLWPKSWQWHNYVTAWQAAPFGQYFINSSIVSISVTVGQLGVTILAAYAFARFNFWGQKFIFRLCLLTMMVPGELLLIPNFVTISQLHWIDSYAGLIVPSLANCFSVLLLKQAFEAVPPSLYRAAQLDGAGDWQTLFQIILPVTRSSVVAVALLQLIASWNAFMWPLIVTNSDQRRTLPVGLQSFTNEAGTNYPLLMAAATFVLLPLLIVYIIGKRYLLKGLSRTGIKG